MIALKLLRLIEAHSEELSLELTQKILGSERTKDYRKLPEHEMRVGALEIYQHLSDWLLTKTDSDIELRYTRLGELRAQQGISLSHFVWAIALTKEHLWGFLRRGIAGPGDRVVRRTRTVAVAGSLF
jgi:hypothetical protein